jgi:hypothetical protein
LLPAALWLTGCTFRVVDNVVAALARMVTDDATAATLDRPARRAILLRYRISRAVRKGSGMDCLAPRGANESTQMTLDFRKNYLVCTVSYSP